MTRRILFVLLMLLVVTSCSSNAATKSGSDETIQLTISAAVSLTDALEEIKEIYEQENNVELTFNLAGSGTLAQQIEQGAPVDLFISANEDWLDRLNSEGLIIENTRVDVTGNKLVLIANESSPLAYESFADILIDDITQIAIGNPESVPAGKYTKEVLQSLHMWDVLEEKLVFAKDVRQVLTYVETENTDLGFVYESDAKSSDKIKVLANSDESRHEPIIYPGAVLTDSEFEQSAKDLLNYLLTDDAQTILKKHGFTK